MSPASSDTHLPRTAHVHRTSGRAAESLQPVEHAGWDPRRCIGVGLLHVVRSHDPLLSSFVFFCLLCSPLAKLLFAEHYFLLILLMFINYFKILLMFINYLYILLMFICYDDLPNQRNTSQLP